MPNWGDELLLPYSCPLKDRSYKAELASVHLLCGSIARVALVRECKRKLLVFLHGECFPLHREIRETVPREMILRPWSRYDRAYFAGRVFADSSLSADKEEPASEHSFALPRNEPLLLDTARGFILEDSIGCNMFADGKSEIRFLLCLSTITSQKSKL